MQNRSLRRRRFWQSSRQFRQRRALLGQRLLVAALNFLINFFPVHRHFGRRGDAELHRFTIHTHHRDVDFSINHDAFADFAREDEHNRLVGGFRQRQRMVDFIRRRVGNDHLLARVRMAVDDNRSFQIHRRALLVVDRHDGQQQRVVGLF